MSVALLLTCGYHVSVIGGGDDFTSGANKDGAVHAAARDLLAEVSGVHLSASLSSLKGHRVIVAPSHRRSFFFLSPLPSPPVSYFPTLPTSASIFASVLCFL